MRAIRLAACLFALPAAVAGGGTPWLNFTDQTAGHLAADPEVGAADTQEKDYAWSDVDGDGDTDLVAVRKQPFTTAGGRRNVLFSERGRRPDRPHRRLHRRLPRPDQ